MDSLHGVDGARIATSLISFANLRGKLTLTDQRRVVFVEQTEPYTKIVFFKPASFDESALANNGDGFLAMDVMYRESLPEGSSRKSSCWWHTKNNRAEVYGGYGLFGPPRPGGGFERCHSGMNGPGEQRRAISDGLLYVESHLGEFPGVRVWTSVRTLSSSTIILLRSSMKLA